MSATMNKGLAASTIANHPKLKVLQVVKPDDEEAKALSVSDTIYASPYFST